MCQDSHCLQFCERNIKKLKKRPQFAHTCLRFKHKKNSGRFVGEEILKNEKDPPMSTYITIHIFAATRQIKATSPSKGGETTVARNSVLIPESRQAMENFKMEVANSLNVNLKQGYNGDLTSREAGSIGGEMVKRMIAYAESNMKK